ncbi:MAG: mechanosensitive ion channel family protein [Flavobacteriaceae bacterium]|nr:mechanosensitive ion channel family protein [Flavobacteriaceae bacterium]
MDKITKYLFIAQERVIFFAPKVLLAVAILWIGFKVIKKLVNLFEIALEKGGMSASIRPFLMSMVTVSLKVILLIVVAGIIGLELTIFATILAASVFAIGMSLQGSLGNFASGLIVLSLKPYDVGDWIQIEDKFGKVEEIGVFNTVVITPGRKTLIIPNLKITSDVVTNYSKKGMIRLEINVTMPYDESFPKIKEIITDALSTVPHILKEPQPEIGIENFDSHNVQIAVRPYVKPDDYWEVIFAAHESIKNEFYKNNIKVAYSEGVEFGKIGE